MLVPEIAFALSRGCGNPTGFADLQSGETVVDFGCGAGIDVALAAHKVGARGKVIGVDFAPHMIERAKQAVTDANVAERAEFVVSGLERVELPERVGATAYDLRPPPRDGCIDVSDQNRGEFADLAHGAGIPLDKIEAMKKSLAATGGASKIIVYDDAGHAFFADYRPSYVVRTAAEASWSEATRWLKAHGV